MAFPFENLENLGWVPFTDIPGAVTRPVAGAELVLDQVRRLNNGMNDLVGCIQFSHTFPLALLEERVAEIWLRMRFRSPLIAAEIIHDTNPEKMGAWVYTPVDLEGANEWRTKTLHFQQFPKGHLTRDFIEDLIQETTTVPLPYGGNRGLLCHCHVLVERDTNRAAIFLHASHTIIDGPALMDCLHLLLEGIIHPERSEHSNKLQWGTEAKNLSPHPVEVFGGTAEGWDTDGIELLERIGRILGDDQATHTISPQRSQPENLNHTRKVSHVFTKEETSKILASVKSLQVTVTVMLEAAHVLSTLALRPPSSPNGRTVLFPSIVAMRHLMKQPWNRRETLVCTGTAIPIVASHSIVQGENASKTERDKMVLFMRDFRQQYTEWMSSPHYVFIVPAQSAMNPIRSAITNADAEITNLGVLERNLNLVWDGANAGERLVVDDFHLGLRRTAPILMTHAWTLGGSMRVQCQGNDMWDVDFLQRFLDEIVRHVRLLL